MLTHSLSQLVITFYSSLSSTAHLSDSAELDTYAVLPACCAAHVVAAAQCCCCGRAWGCVMCCACGVVAAPPVYLLWMCPVRMLLLWGCQAAVPACLLAVPACLPASTPCLVAASCCAAVAALLAAIACPSFLLHLDCSCLPFLPF